MFTGEWVQFSKHRAGLISKPVLVSSPVSRPSRLLFMPIVDDLFAETLTHYHGYHPHKELQ